MMTKATKAKPAMWGPAIVGFGDHEYFGASGKATNMVSGGFSPRKAALSLYLMGGKDEKLLAKTRASRRPAAAASTSSVSTTCTRRRCRN